MPNRLSKINFLIIFVGILLLNGCSTIYNPATQRREFYFIGPKKEISIGRSMDRQIQGSFPILLDPKMNERLSIIGALVSGVSDRKKLTYQFRIINNPELNAFAIPGGFVYVNSGLINLANDDELACVLGHEIGHIAARHSVKRLQVNMGYNFLINVAANLTGQHLAANAVNIAFNIIQNGYSRQDEFLADRLAVKYARKANFNPNGMVTFFEKMQQEAQKRGSGFKFFFLSSHPPIKERIKQVKNEIAKSPPSLPKRLPYP